MNSRLVRFSSRISCGGAIGIEICRSPRRTCRGIGDGERDRGGDSDGNRGITGDGGLSGGGTKGGRTGDEGTDCKGDGVAIGLEGDGRFGISIGGITGESRLTDDVDGAAFADRASSLVSDSVSVEDESESDESELDASESDASESVSLLI